MPNNCNSISKIIFVCCVVFLSACSSLPQSTISEKRYIGKFNLSQNNQVSSFIVLINVFPNDFIIQVSRPILGNLIKIKFNQNDGVIYDQEIDEVYSTLFSIFNKKEYFYFFNSCFYDLNAYEKEFKINKDKTEWKCEYDGLNSLSMYFVTKDNLSLSGVLKSE